MLPLPLVGVSQSRTEHNGDLQIFCDWVEGSLLFADESRLSRTDIQDVLREQGIYDDQAFADEWLENVWGELKRREGLLDASAPFKVEARAVAQTKNWDDVPSYAFCVLTPLLQNSKTWGPRRQAFFIKQGALFERLSEESLRSAGWQTHKTGWSDRNAKKLPAVVKELAAKIGEPELVWDRNVSDAGNEAGLDVVFFWPFHDRRSGHPIFLAQCASGENWKRKLSEPSLDVWVKLIDFPSRPHRAFALPHSLNQKEMRYATVRVDGMVLDRYRLHDKARPQDWCSATLAADIRAFMRPVVAGLPRYK